MQSNVGHCSLQYRHVVRECEFLLYIAHNHLPSRYMLDMGMLEAHMEMIVKDLVKESNNLLCYCSLFFASEFIFS